MDLAGNLALEAAQDLFLGSALGGASGDVFLGGLVAVHADQGDPPQGAICPASPPRCSPRRGAGGRMVQARGSGETMTARATAQRGMTGGWSAPEGVGKSRALPGGSPRGAASRRLAVVPASLGRWWSPLRAHRLRPRT